MILFKKEHEKMILSGRKTQTRRIGKKRWKIGSTHQARLNFKDPYFAKLLITNVYLEKLVDISDEDVYNEGYDSKEEYFNVFRNLNGDIDLDSEIWVVCFKVIDSD